MLPLKAEAQRREREALSKKAMRKRTQQNKNFVAFVSRICYNKAITVVEPISVAAPGEIREYPPLPDWIPEWIL